MSSIIITIFDKIFRVLLDDIVFVTVPTSQKLVASKTLWPVGAEMLSLVPI